MRAAFFLFGLAMFACGTAETTAESDIINGEVDQAAVHDAVVLLVRRDQGRTVGSCTATLVAPNLVLTARHCVSKVETGQTFCRTDGTSEGGAGILESLAASELRVYTGRSASKDMYDDAKSSARGASLIVEEDRSVFCDGDVAFVALDRDIDGPVAPIRVGGAPSDGESITAVGWGMTESETTPEQRQMRAVNIQKVGPFAFGTSSTVGLGSSEFSVAEAFCFGDSGGPSFTATGAVAGVASRSGNRSTETGVVATKCMGSETRGIYTHMASREPLIDRAFAVAGYPVRTETKPVGKKSGSSCKANIDCASNRCEAKRCASVEIVPAQKTSTQPAEPKEVPSAAEEAPAEEPPLENGTWLKLGCSQGSQHGSPASGGCSFLVLACLLAARRRRP